MFKKSNKIRKEYRLAKIKVVGIGGAGNNAVSRMYKNFPRSVDLIAVNTDVQDLKYAKAKKKIHIGKNLTKGLGTGMNPELGRQAAEASRPEISEALKGADMVFITAGEGGGTGTGAAPIIAEIAKELGILTVAIVTKPFSFEGIERTRIAQEGIMRLRDKVDTFIVIPNDRIFSLIDKNTSLYKAFEKIDEVLKNSVLGITELITSPGIINVDFSDVKAVMADAGSAVIGIAEATGSERSTAAARQVINSPLLESSIYGAKGVLFAISGHRDLKMNEINEIAELIAENTDQSAKIIFGAYYDRKLKKGQLKVTLVATGFDAGLNSKSNLMLSSLFLSHSDKIETDKIKNEIKEEVKIEPSASSKLPLEATKQLKKKDKDKEKEKKMEEIWDIPTFLRKRKR
jgi:cell division protein FtsZ